jgi:hypothetical protein
MRRDILLEHPAELTSAPDWSWLRVLQSVRKCGPRTPELRRGLSEVEGQVRPLELGAAAGLQPYPAAASAGVKLRQRWWVLRDEFRNGDGAQVIARQRREDR